MRRVMLWLSLSLLGGAAFAQEVTPGTQIKGKTVAFTLTVPQGWQSAAYDKPEDRTNAKMIFSQGLLGDDPKVTDNFNLWWSPGDENLMAGLASFHRVELPADTTVKTALAALVESKKLPEGMEAKPTQFGKYAGLLAGGVVQQMFYAAVIVIPQGKVAYVATIIGPQTAVQPQWPTFMKLVASLEAPDLKPQKVEEVMGTAPAAGE